MSEKQLNFINIFDEQIELDQQEKAEKVRIAAEQEADLITPGLLKYWEELQKDEQLSSQRLAIVRTYDDVSLTELRPFKTEIDWYIERMARFKLACDQAERGESYRRAYDLFVDPDIKDKKYLDTAKLFIKYREAVKKDSEWRQKENQQHAVEKAAADKKEQQRVNRAAKVKADRQRQKDKEAEAVKNAQQASAAALLNMKTGKNAASGDYLDYRNDDLRLDPNQLKNKPADKHKDNDNE